MINVMTRNEGHPRQLHHETACPYNGISVCIASLSLMAIDTKKDNCCTTEDYDNCPIFLSKVLRKS